MEANVSTQHMPLPVRETHESENLTHLGKQKNWLYVIDAMYIT